MNLKFFYTAADLKDLPTISTGQCCSLKLHTDEQRVWLCRVEGGVSVETYNEARGRWEVTSGSCHADEAHT